MPISTCDSEWDRFGWRIPGLSEEYQSERKTAFLEDQARRLLGEGKLGGEKSVTSEETALPTALKASTEPQRLD